MSFLAGGYVQVFGEIQCFQLDNGSGYRQPSFPFFSYVLTPLPVNLMKISELEWTRRFSVNDLNCGFCLT